MPHFLMFTKFDWLIFGSFAAVLIVLAVVARRFNRSVADFLAANRCARRYLLGVSEGVAGVGALALVALFEAHYEAGFAFGWWMFLTQAVLILLALSGWVVYRYRQTRALTLAQFLEQRYSRRFRIFSGILIFVSGVINFGIFPAVGARFFMTICDLPSWPVLIPVLGTIDATYAITMFVLTGTALLFVLLGGLISVVLTDFVQGIFFNAVLCITLLYLLFTMPWGDITAALMSHPSGGALFNPFKTSASKDFNIWFYLIQAFAMFYTVRAWQGNQGYFGAAVNAHEAKMGNILGWWAYMTQRLMIIVIPVILLAVMLTPNYSGLSQSVLAHAGEVGNDAIRKQITPTVVLLHFLPTGLLGLFAAAVFGAFIGNVDTYLHSWGSVFVQDVLMPIKNKRIPRDQHIRYLRLAICGVAVFIFLFSLFFPQNDYIFMFTSLSGSLWLAGAGSVIIGGLYWNKGTTAAGYGALIVGLVVSLLGFVLPRIFPEIPVSAMVFYFVAMVLSILAYVAISLLGPRSVFDLGRLLGSTAGKSGDQKSWRTKLLSKEFTLGDRVIYLGITGVIITALILFLVFTAINLVNPGEDSSWMAFWHAFVWVAVGLGSATTLWFLIGGSFDVVDMLRRLRTVVRDDRDDGTVREEGE